MKAQIVELELFTQAELESLEFVPEELEAIEQERVPDLESISFEDIAEDLEAILEADNPRMNALSDPEYLRIGQTIRALQSRIRSEPDGSLRKLAWRQEMQRLAGLRQAIVRRYEREAEARRRQEELQRLFGHLRRPTPPRPPSPRPPSPPRPPAPGPQSRQNQSRSLTRSLSGLGSRRSGGASS